MAISDILRVFLAGYFLLAGLLYTTKILAHRARTGQHAQSFGPPGSAQFIGRSAFELFRWAILLACLARVAWPEIDTAFGPIPALLQPSVQIAGAGLMLGGLALVLYVHGYLGAEWRSGVPREGPAALLTHGPYAVLRHPIFLGVHLAQLGFFLAWPTIFTAVCLAVGVGAIQLQARVEEARMARAFGAAYLRYRAGVPGFIPWKLKPARDAAVVD